MAKKHIEALEMAPKYKSFFISRTVVYAQSVCPNSWKVREKYSSSRCSVVLRSSKEI